MKCVLLGATRGCGLETLLNLHKAGHECYLLARNSTAAAETLSAQGVPANSPLLHIVQGDAFEAGDVRRLFTAAGEVDFVMFSLGTLPPPPKDMIVLAAVLTLPPSSRWPPLVQKSSLAKAGPAANLHSLHTNIPASIHRVLSHAGDSAPARRDFFQRSGRSGSC